MSVKTGDRTDGGRGALVVQWLGLCAFTARGMGLIPGWGNKILHALQSVPTSAPTPTPQIKGGANG